MRAEWIKYGAALIGKPSRQKRVDWYRCSECRSPVSRGFKRGISEDLPGRCPKCGAEMNQ